MSSIKRFRFITASLPILAMIFMLFYVLVLSGCRSSYSFSSYRTQAETAMMRNKLKKARELYSVIYQQETSAETIDQNRTTWAFYRLGVIAEVLGEIQLAKGYYWGDKIDEGFYEVNPSVNWLAETGWAHLDEGNSPRTLDEILALENAGPKKAMPAAEKKKREVIVPAKAFVPQAAQTSEKSYSRTFQRSLTPPRPGAPEPFRVFY